MSERLFCFRPGVVPFLCQRDGCVATTTNAESTKVCFDNKISITYAPERPPPLYMCVECANDIHREHPQLTFTDLLHPLQQISMVCENKVSY